MLYIMANPKEKIFLIYHGMLGGLICDAFMKYVEHDLGGDSRTEPHKYIHWMRVRGGRMYVLGTLEDTVWTPDKIVAKIKKNVADVGTLFVVEIQGMACQGLMDQEFWDFYKSIQDLTKTVVGGRRAKKLKKIKFLIDKKEELKRKDIELRNREADVLKRKEMLSEEEELLKKEEEIRKQEAEVAQKEVEIKKRKKFLGIF
jgi:hypothetical protein